MNTFNRSAQGLLAASALLLVSPAVSQETPDSSETTAPKTTINWVEADAGSKARSFPDRAGSLVTELEAGQLLKVVETSSGTRPFHRVQVAGGFMVWVHGSFVTPTRNPAVLTVSGDRLNMRPMASSGPDSMALPDRLMLGTQVELAGRQDASLPLDKDWVQIWAPPGSTLWVEGSETTVRTDEALAATEFAAAARVMPKVASKPKVTSKPKPQKVTPLVKPGARRALTEADALYEAAVKMTDADSATWTAVQKAYQKVQTLSGASTPLAQVASRQAERCALRAQLADLGGDMTERDESRRQRIAQLLDEQRLREMARTPDWGRFDGRGWVESVKSAGESTRWYIWWAGKRRVELVSGDGRYDLNSYVGYQVGMAGAMRREYSPPTLEQDELLPLLDIRRLEVIAGGRKRR
ncbi:MAG: hypothetical protein CMJ86_03890 [Planctomycetes bacterium]|nr:hypothetical protein [Planctomycetota bacterium]